MCICMSLLFSDPLFCSLLMSYLSYQIWASFLFIFLCKVVNFFRTRAVCPTHLGVYAWSSLAPHSTYTKMSPFVAQTPEWDSCFMFVLYPRSMILLVQTLYSDYCFSRNFHNYALILFSQQWEVMRAVFTHVGTKAQALQ